VGGAGFIFGSLAFVSVLNIYEVAIGIRPQPDNWSMELVIFLLLAIFLLAQFTIGWKDNELFVFIVFAIIGSYIITKLRLFSTVDSMRNAAGHLSAFILLTSIVLVIGDLASIGIANANNAPVSEKTRILQEIGAYRQSISTPSNTSEQQDIVDIAIRFLVAIFCFVVSFGISSYFFREIFPYEKGTELSYLYSSISGLLISLIFSASVWKSFDLWTKLVGNIQTGMSAVIATVLSLLFVLMGGFLFWRKLKSFIKGAGMG
jgi:hypothetical protein